MTKTPNPQPEDLEPVTDRAEYVPVDDIGPSGVAPMSGRSDKRRDSTHPPARPKR